MVDYQEFYNDERFKCNLLDVKRIFRKKIKKYEITQIEIGNILKNYNRNLIELDETITFKYINGEASEDEYKEYCINNTLDYEKHSSNSYSKLKSTMEDYSLEKGAIIIDQFNIIMDGQHRSCLLLKEYGKKHMVNVVKVYYKNLEIKLRILYLIYTIKKRIRSVLNEK